MWSLVYDHLEARSKYFLFLGIYPYRIFITKHNILASEKSVETIHSHTHYDKLEQLISNVSIY